MATTINRDALRYADICAQAVVWMGDDEHGCEALAAVLRRAGWVCTPPAAQAAPKKRKR